jgi:ribosome-binding factor A
MVKDRIARLNSLLKEVIAEVIHRDVRNPHVHRLASVTSVDVSKDLQHAKVYISIIGTPAEKQATIAALQTAAGYISILASKKVVMRYFPALIFKLDESVDKQIAIDAKLEQIHVEQQSRTKYE